MKTNGANTELPKHQADKRLKHGQARFQLSSNLFQSNKEDDYYSCKSTYSTEFPTNECSDN